jgi:hypothetical protein
VVRVHRRHDQATARRIVQHALVAQQQQGLLHRLARDAELLRDLLLDDAFARLQVALRDVRHECVVHLSDQFGRCRDDFHGARVYPRLNSVFSIP